MFCLNRAAKGRRHWTPESPSQEVGDFQDLERESGWLDGPGHFLPGRRFPLWAFGAAAGVLAEDNGF